MWPVDYILSSAYSPLRVENQLTDRCWRDAFEDLLALESGNEMISSKSRMQERKMAFRIHCGVTHFFVNLTSRQLRDRALVEERVRERRNIFVLWGALDRVARIDNEVLPYLKNAEDVMTQQTKTLLQNVEKASHRAPSLLKDRGQWIASLVSSGVLPGWSSRLDIASWHKEPHISMRKSTYPRVQPDGKDRIAFTEEELRLRFRNPESSESKTPDDKSLSRTTSLGSGKVPDLPEIVPRDLIAQTTRSERISLPDGSTANKVILTNHSSNGKEEEIEIVDNAAEVLDKVERAIWLMRRFGIHW